MKIAAADATLNETFFPAEQKKVNWRNSKNPQSIRPIVCVPVEQDQACPVYPKQMIHLPDQKQSDDQVDSNNTVSYAFGKVPCSELTDRKDDENGYSDPGEQSIHQYGCGEKQRETLLCVQMSFSNTGISGGSCRL